MHFITIQQIRQLLKMTPINLDINQPIFFTSDTHFGHANIIKYCKRPFKDVDEMDDKLIENWNAKVPNDAIVFHLGDFSFKFISVYRKHLNGDIHLIMGNHDKEDFAVYNDLFEGVKSYHELKIHNGPDVQKIVLFHYPILSWSSRMHGAWHLYGHVHEKDMGPLEGTRSLNICVEKTDYSPLSLLEVKQRIESRTIITHAEDLIKDGKPRADNYRNRS